MQNKGTLKGKHIYFISGASGVGKTTLMTMLKEKYNNRQWAFLHFDEIGVPEISEMIKNFGSPVAWQEAKAHEWINKAVHNYNNEKVFLEGQVNLDFIEKGFEKQGFIDYTIVLLDCSDDVMEKRLREERNQPELADDKMKNWLIFLRMQAMKFGAIRIDTTYLSTVETLKAFEDAVKLEEDV
jgi:broad-specificity NMP kinase